MNNAMLDFSAGDLSPKTDVSPTPSGGPIRPSADSILFVDDEPNVLNGLRRMLRGKRNVWNMEFVEGGAQALERLQNATFAIVVTDMRMPGIDGAELLKEVARRSPQTVRIILSGQSDQAGILKAADCAHQFLAKPCDPNVLLGRLAQVFALRDRLANPTVMRLSAAVQSLPSLPGVYQTLVREVQSSFSSINRVGEIMSQDIAMSAKLLHLTISSFFSTSQTVSNPAQAATLMGLDLLKSLVLTEGVISNDGRANRIDAELQHLTRHSIAVGEWAKAIAQAEHCDSRCVEEAFAAGLLHDLGKLVLMASLPEQFAQLRQRVASERREALEVEREIFGATHPEVGACLLGLWGLPPSIIDAIADHHHPRASSQREFSPLTAVHVADAFSYECFELSRSAGDRTMRTHLDIEYLAGLGLTDRLPAWRSKCGLPPAGAALAGNDSVRLQLVHRFAQ